MQGRVSGVSAASGAVLEGVWAVVLARAVVVVVQALVAWALVAWAGRAREAAVAGLLEGDGGVGRGGGVAPLPPPCGAVRGLNEVDWARSADAPTNRAGWLLVWAGWLCTRERGESEGG